MCFRASFWNELCRILDSECRKRGGLWVFLILLCQDNKVNHSKNYLAISCAVLRILCNTFFSFWTFILVLYGWECGTIQHNVFALMLPFSICLLFAGYHAKPALKLSGFFCCCFCFLIFIYYLATWHMNILQMPMY